MIPLSSGKINLSVDVGGGERKRNPRYRSPVVQRSMMAKGEDEIPILSLKENRRMHESMDFEYLDKLKGAKSAMG